MSRVVPEVCGHLGRLVLVRHGMLLLMVVLLLPLSPLSWPLMLILMPPSPAPAAAAPPPTPATRTPAFTSA